MTHDVYIAGISMTPFGKRLDESVKSLTTAAVRDALDDAGIETGNIEAAWFSNTRQPMLEGQNTIRGQIALRAAAAPEERLLIQVADTGAGIQPEDLPHVFDRFYRADKSRTDDDGASGLGLAIARALVLAHEGTITAESAPGQGTVFNILLPAANHSA